MQTEGKKKFSQILLVIWVLLLLTLNGKAQNTDSPGDDNQFWHETSVSVPLNKNLTLAFFGVSRIGRDFKNLIDERAGVVLTSKLNRHLTIFGGYLYRVVQPAPRIRRFENRSLGGFTVSAPLAKFVFSNRNTFEYRANNSRPDSINYRNRTTVEKNVEIFDIKFKPYLSFEVFYDPRPKRWFRQRYTIGATKNLNKKLVGEIFYIRQQDVISRPGNLNVIGTVLRVQL
jgi:hypothetical protein